MYIIGLTGNMGSGKSTVARLLASYGIPVYDSDARAKDLNDNDPQIISALKHLFGEEIYETQGKLNRALLAQQIFGDSQMLAQVNAIIHPAVQRDFEAWCAHHASAPLVIKEAAILFESGAHKQVHATLLVEAPGELAIQRVAQRDGISPEAVLQRLQHQWPVDKKRALADYVINNDEQASLICQIEQWLTALPYHTNR